MKKFSLALLAMAVAFAFTQAAKADSIGVTSTSGDASFTSSGLTVIPGGTGTVETNSATTGMFTTLGGDTVSLNSFNFDNSADGVTVWDDTDNGHNISFTIESLNVLNVTPGFGFLIYGDGLLDDNGTEINVTYTSSGNGSGDSFSYGVNATTTPEPSSLLLLGTGLLGLAFVAFRKAKPARPAMNLSL